MVVGCFTPFRDEKKSNNLKVKKCGGSVRRPLRISESLSKLSNDGETSESKV